MLGQKKYSLDEIKEILNNLIKKYIPEEHQFSVNTFDEKQISLLITILSEKDDKKRAQIRETIKKGIEEINNIEKEIKEQYKQILNLQKEFNAIHISMSDLNELKDQIIADDILKNI